MSEWPRNPFVGLRPFRSDEALLFFGRRQQATELLKELYKTHFLAVVGSSGCGKSSLIQAGMIPRLTAGFLVEERDLWTFRVLTPGHAPRARLAAEFGISENVVREQGAPALVAQLAQQPDAGSRNCLLLVDQFEEIFSFVESASNRDEAADFVGILLALAAQRHLPVFVVLTMRSDFLGDCDVFHGLPEAINRSHYLVPRLTRSQRQEAIEGPVRLVGQTITPQLVDRVLNDLGDDQDQLPVMQHALLRTWERWQSDGGEAPIDLSHYLGAGGVRYALSRDADAALNEMSAEERRLAIRIFQALTDTDVNNRPVRRSVRLSELERETGASRAAITPILERFHESGRSFVVLRQNRDSDDASVHISHESLIRQWRSLGDWVDKERRSRDQYLRLVDLAQRHARGQEGLLRNPGLQLALGWRDNTKPTEAWAKRYGEDFTLAMSYLTESEEQRKKEQREKENQQKLQLELAEERGRSSARETLLRWAVTLAILGFAAAAVAIYQWRNARYQTDVANSSRLALLARSRAEGDLDLALLLNLEAFKTAPTFEALSGLLTLAGRSPHPGRFLHGHTGVVQAVAFNPDGRFAASGGRDGKVIVWDLETGARTLLVEGGSGSRIVAFSPDGRLLAATVSCDGTLSLWNTKTWKLVRKLSGGQNDVRSLAFSLDGQRLAAGAYDRSIVVWTDLPGIAQRNVQSTVEPLTLARSPSEVVSVAFSPRGTLLASGHRNGSVLLWDTRLMKSRELRKHREVVTSLAFSPDGRLLISASDDRTMVVWDALDVKATTPLQSIGGPRSVKSVAVSRDGRLLASAGDDRTIRLWDISQTEPTEIHIDERLPLVGHGSFIESVAFSADGKQLASGDWDGKLILWDLGKESLVDAVIEDPHHGPIGALAWSPDGKSLAWTDADGYVVRRNLVTQKYELDKRAVPKGRGVALTFDPNGRLVWSGLDGREFSRQDVQTGQSLDSVQLSGAVAPGLAVSPDGRLLAYGTQATQVDERLLHEILVWDLDAGRQAHKFENGDVQVESLTFSPDVRVLASGRGAGLVVLWDLASEKELGRLVGHEGTVRSLAFSPDGKWLAAGSWDRRIFIWDLSMRQLLGVLSTGHARAVSGLTFSPDGKRLASGGDSDGKIRLWNIGADALRKHASRTANRPLPPEELRVILGPDIRYR